MNGQNNDGMRRQVCIDDLAGEGVDGAVSALETAEQKRTSANRTSAGMAEAAVDYMGAAIRASFVSARVPACLKAYLVCAAAAAQYAQAGYEGSMQLMAMRVKAPAATLMDALGVANNAMHGRHIDFGSEMAATGTITAVLEEANKQSSGFPVGMLLERLADTDKYGNLCTDCPNYKAPAAVA